MQQMTQTPPGIKGTLIIFSVVSGLILITLLIIYIVMKTIQSGKEPEMLSRFNDHIEISIQNTGTLPFQLGKIEFKPSSFLNLSKKRDTDTVDIYSKKIVFPQYAKISSQAWYDFLHTTITTGNCPHTLLGNLFMSLDKSLPHLSVFINGENKAGASSQYDIQLLEDGNYKINIHDYFEHFNKEGPRNITTGFKNFSCNTTGEDDIIYALSNLLDQLGITN